MTVASVVAELPGDWLENVCTREFNKVSFSFLAHARMRKKIQTKLSHRVTTWLVTQRALRQFGELSYLTLSGSLSKGYERLRLTLSLKAKQVQTLSFLRK